MVSSPLGVRQCPPEAAEDATEEAAGLLLDVGRVEIRHFAVQLVPVGRHRNEEHFHAPVVR